MDYIKLIEAEEQDRASILSEFGYNSKGERAKHPVIEIKKLLEISDKSYMKLADAFATRWDYLSSEAILKRHILGRSFGRDEIPAFSNLNPDDFRKLFAGEKSNIPQALSKTIVRARKDYEKESSMPRIGAIFFRDWFEFLISSLPGDNDFIKKYYAIAADSANIIYALRLLHAGERSKDLSEFALKGGMVPVRFLESLWDTDIQGACSRLSRTVYGKEIADSAIMSFNEGDLSILDQAMNRIKLRYLSDSRFCAFGPEILISYFERRMMEESAVRAIVRLKSAGLPQDMVKKAVSYVFD
jgi:vacuolar-type H+-ATPase subunit C/Vma6